MALSSKFVDQNVQAPSHILMQQGAEILNFKPAHIPVANTDDWAALVEGGYFYDEVGTGRKLSGVRSYFTSTEIVNQMIADAITAADQRHYFNPTTQTNPTAPSGSIKAGDVFVVTADGTWNGLALRAGDILEATADITGTPTLNNFLLNQAVSGLESVAEATEALAGIVTITQTVRVDGSATHAKVTTEKAVADAITALQTTIMSAVTGIQSNLQGQIDTLSGSVSALSSRVSDTEADITTINAKNVEQDGRLDSIDQDITAVESELSSLDSRIDTLEEWTVMGVNVELGNGTDAVYIGAVPMVEFKSPDDVSFTLKASDGNGGYINNGAIFPVTLINQGGVQKVKAVFASAPAAGKYAVRIVGLGKIAVPA
jgi:hypothetical protein